MLTARWTLGPPNTRLLACYWKLLFPYLYHGSIWIGYFNNVPNLQIGAEYPINTSSKLCVLLLTDHGWEFQNNALWDTLKHVLSNWFHSNWLADYHAASSGINHSQSFPCYFQRSALKVYWWTILHTCKTYRNTQKHLESVFLIRTSHKHTNSKIES